MKGIFSNKRVLVIIGIVVAAVAFFINGFVQQKKEEEKQKEIEKLEEQYAQQREEEMGEVSDNMVINMQKDLIASYGELPDGYLWDIDGSLLSKGDKSMSAEEVVYAYLNGIRTLDMSMVQKYSRGSVVIDTYEGYFDENDKNVDYTDQFMRNMYKEAMLSMQIKGIDNVSVFAENKQVFTVSVSMLDLTNKDFWLEDKEEIYRTLGIYDSDEADSAKADIYLYDYISNYYKSGRAAKRTVQFDLTVQRYPDLDTGWLVSIDTDIDNACRYADGKLVVSYIKEMFVDEGIDMIREEHEEEEGFEDNFIEDTPVLEDWEVAPDTPSTDETDNGGDLSSIFGESSETVVETE